MSNTLSALNDLLLLLDKDERLLLLLYESADALDFLIGWETLLL